MIIDDLKADDESVTATTAATEQSDKVEATAKDDQTSEANTEEGKEPGAAKTEAEKAAEASEAGKKLNQYKQSASARVQEAVARQREAERTAQRALDRVAQLEAKLKPPIADEYTDPAKLNADQIAHALDQRRVQELKDQSTEAIDEAGRARAVAWWERVESFKADNADFDQVALTAPIGKETSLMVADMEDGPAVAYHLGKNPAEARRIEGLPERQRPFALGKIAAQVTAPPPRRVTSAPSPIDATSGKSGGGSGFDPAKASVEDYSAEYRKNFKKG